MEEDYLDEVTSLLEQIRDFRHDPECCSRRPVYWCDCYEKDQRDLADEALEILYKNG